MELFFIHERDGLNGLMQVIGASVLSYDCSGGLSSYF